MLGLRTLPRFWTPPCNCKSATHGVPANGHRVCSWRVCISVNKRLSRRLIDSCFIGICSDDKRALYYIPRQHGFPIGIAVSLFLALYISRQESWDVMIYFYMHMLPSPFFCRCRWTSQHPTSSRCTCSIMASEMIGVPSRSA